MKTIMVVDDMPIIREPIAKALASRGYETLSIGGGLEALQAVARQRPDLILLDMMMPVCDGIAVLRNLKSDARNADIPVIMLTAAADKEGILEAAKLGVKDYVLKSHFNMANLVERIEACFSRNETAPKDGGLHIGGPALNVTASATQEQSSRQLAQTSSLTTRDQIMERLARCGELKPLSPTVSRLLELVNGNDCSTERIAKTIQQDQAIAVKILKLANSVLYTRGAPVDSVNKAVQRIGTNPIKQLIINLGVIDQFGSIDGCPRLSATQFWEHSIACGLIAAEITRSRGCEAQADAAFTMGLMHDVGRMVFAQVLGEQYNRVLEMADELRLPLEQVESRLLSVNHAEVLEAVLRNWRFPKEMIRPIGMHHLSIAPLQRAAGDAFAEAATLALANRLAHAMMLGSSGNDTIYPTDDFVKALHLSPEVIKRIEHDVPGQTDEIKFAMLSRSNQEPWPSRRNEFRRSVKHPVRPIYISATRDIDAFRMVCDQLRDDVSGEAPNIGVVYVREPGETKARLAELQSVEMAAGVGPLPLILVCPDCKSTFDDALNHGRLVRLLPTGFSISTFTWAVGGLVGAAPAVSPAA